MKGTNWECEHQETRVVVRPRCIEVWCFSVAHEVEHTMATINVLINLQNKTKDKQIYHKKK